MKRLTKGLILPAAVVGAVFGLAVSAMADYIADIQANNTTGQTVEIDNTVGTPVVTALLSTPGTVHGRTYSNWAFYVNDGTGGMDVFVNSATLAAVAPGYTPHLGDGLDIKGNYT